MIFQTRNMTYLILYFNICLEVSNDFLYKNPYKDLQSYQLKFRVP